MAKRGPKPKSEPIGIIDSPKKNQVRVQTLDLDPILDEPEHKCNCDQMEHIWAKTINDIYTKIEVLERLCAIIAPRSFMQAHNLNEEMLQVNKQRLILFEKYYGDFGPKRLENPSINRFAKMTPDELQTHRMEEQRLRDEQQKNKK